MDYIINNSINNFNLENNFVYNYVISELITNINKSRIVSSENKLKFLNYYNNIGTIDNIQFNNNPLAATIIFCLSDLNKYDMFLINNAANYGLGIDKILMLLLLTNIYDLDLYCKQNKIPRDGCTKLLTLRKLSEIYKLEHNF